MILIVGLGNPGQKYKQTKHNIGFMVIDKLIKDLLPNEASSSARRKHNRFKGEYVKVGSKLVVVKPQTYMNHSGVSVKKFIDFYKVEINNLWVIHDDIDLPLGKIRIRIGAGAGGHKGVESIVKELGSSDFVRFRLGIGRGESDTQQFVLSHFLEEEEERKEQLVKEAANALRLALVKGLEAAMNEYN